MFKTHDQQIKKLLSAKKSPTDWARILEHHSRMILRIQHERLIHLLVLIFVGIIMSASSVVVILTKTPDLLIISLLLIILFIGYLLHYRFLENTTQSWYQFEDDIKERI
jgi:hypothetical protein